MSTVNNNFYKEVGSNLEGLYPAKPHKYLYSQNYLKDAATHPFDPIVPLTEDFFGPRNLTLLVVSKRYTLPNVASSVALDTIKRVYKNWAEYKVYIWVDLVLAQLIIDASDDDTYYNDMVDMSDQLQTICDDMKDYGFVWKGTLSDGKDAAFFKPFIDEFFS